MSIFDIRNLSVGYNGEAVLRGISLELPGGEITVILGKSGCGKSTLMKAMTGLEPPLEGELVISGTVVDFASEASLHALYRRIGVLYQSSALLNSLTLYDNVALPLRMRFRGMPLELEDQMVRHRLGQVGLWESRGKFPSELSGGMKKRGALARAMIHSPEIIFCDEPSAGLDPMTAKEIDELLLRLNRVMGITLVVVTHELRSIEKIADRVLALHDGGIRFWGVKEDLFSQNDVFIDNFFLRKDSDDH